jgi:hypothetical protein
MRVAKIQVFSQEAKASGKIFNNQLLTLMLQAYLANLCSG